MSLRLLLDENLPPALRDAILRLDGGIDVVRVGDAGAPPLGTSDPDILWYLQDAQRVLITNNRVSIPRHLIDHTAAGGCHWGIFWFRPSMSLGELANEIHFLCETSNPEDWRDQTGWLPI
jgi:hypothetical protein